MRLTAVFATGLAFALFSLSISSPAGDAPPNLIPNASFEKSDNDSPEQWRPQRWAGKGEFKYAETGRTGSRSVAIESAGGADIGWATTVEVRPWSTYRLSGWIKTENVQLKGGEGALFNLHNMQGIKTPAVTGTKDWARVETIFETGGNDTLQVNCLFGGWGLATGKAWYDDVQLEEISVTELKPSVTIDVTSMTAPISPYIYGQFIEHLGRCIYGGIWAEMLQDRKFFYPVNNKRSPWKTAGGGDYATSAPGPSFVGEYTPQIELAEDGSPRGVVQGKLELQEGHAYTGRVLLSGTGAPLPVEISLVWGEGPDDRRTIAVRGIASEYMETPLYFMAGADTDNGRLEIVARGKGTLRVGTASLMPADNVRGMRADTLRLLEELDAPVYRWPGGNFVSGYNWKDGIGPRDRRPPRKNPAWRGVEHNDFGIHEFIDFCREVGAEPLVVVNSGQGGVDSAVEELLYANGAPDTPPGQLRAANGSPQPFGVRWWGIGNEMYGNWQLGHMPLEDYVKKHNAFAEAMRKTDPRIKLIAVGAVGNWSETMMAECADHMDLISEHFYRQEQQGLLSHVRQIPESVKRIADAHRRYRETIPALEGKNIRIALDEWNYWYGPHVYGELGTRYFLKDALGIAAGLHEFFRNSDIFFMANYAQTVNVIGAIKTSKTAAAFATTGLALKLYRRHYGVFPVAVDGAPEPLDIVAAWTRDRSFLTIAVVNPTREKISLELNLKGIKGPLAGSRWEIAGDDPMAYNEPGKPPRVEIVEKKVDAITDRLELAPVSISLFSLAPVPREER